MLTGGPKFNSSKKNEIFQEYTKVSNLVDAPVRKFGSAALGMSYVAAGRFDGYWEWELNYWDIAAGMVILKEAGGFVNFFEADKDVAAGLVIVKEAGGYIEFIEHEAINSTKRNILATNSSIQEELKVAILKKNIE